MGKAESPKLPRGVTIRKHSQGETINITFTYRGVKCREPLSNLEVNSKNLKYAERTLGEIHNKIERGTFVYAEYFPRSARLKLFGNAAAGKTVKMYLDISIYAKRENFLRRLLAVIKNAVARWPRCIHFRQANSRQRQ